MLFDDLAFDGIILSIKVLLEISIDSKSERTEKEHEEVSKRKDNGLYGSVKNELFLQGS